MELADIITRLKVASIEWAIASRHGDDAAAARWLEEYETADRLRDEIEGTA